MYSDIWYQVVLFLVFLCFGIACAFVFDAFRISERFTKPNIIISAVKDISFWLIVLILMFAICLRFNNGEIRFFMFVGIMLGGLIYFNTVSKYVVMSLFFLVNLFKKIIKALVKILLMPMKLLLKIFNKPVIVALSFSKKSFVKLKSKLQFRLKKLKKFKK